MGTMPAEQYLSCMASLSRRQRQVVGQFVRGRPLKAIAIDLGVTISTVARHVALAERRLGLRRWDFGHVVNALADPRAERARSVYLSLQLTPAERAVVAHVLGGWSNARVAAAKGGSARTVANQLASAYRKLGVGSRAELYALYGLRGTQTGGAGG
jgi:DNA-binding CsgD family transcriptional regulator